MERHFSSKVNFQPYRRVPFTFRPKFRIHHSEMGLETRIFVNGTARFCRTGPTGQRGPPPEVVPNIPAGPNRNGPFHLTSARNFRKFCLNVFLFFEIITCVFILKQLFASGSVIIGEYSPRLRLGEYSPIITEPEANNCFSINTQVIISKKRKKKKFQREIIFTYSGKTTAVIASQ